MQEGLISSNEQIFKEKCFPLSWLQTDDKFSLVPAWAHVQPLETSN